MFKRIWLFLVTNIAVVLLLTAVMFVLERFFGIALTGNSYLFVFALIIGFGWAGISLLLSKWMAKRAYDLVMITNDNLDQLDEKERVVWQTVQDLAERHHIKMPEVWIYKDIDPNAFATWSSKNNSLVAVSTGLINLMEKDAIEWVIAHEMAHVLNGDMVTMALLQWVLNTFVVFFARVVANIVSNFLDEELSWLAYYAIVFVLEIVFWLLASIILMAFSRHREFKADAWAASYVWSDKMIAWLEALKTMKDSAPGSKWKLATMKISTKSSNGFMKLFSSHPDLDERISVLKKI